MYNKKFKYSASYLEYLNSIDKSFYIDVLEHCTNEVYVSDAEGTVIYVNPRAMQNYGLEPEKLVGKTNYDVWEGMWYPRVIDRCIAERRSICVLQTYLITGKELVTVATPVFDENDQVVYVVCVVQEEEQDYDISYKNIEGAGNKKEPAKIAMISADPFWYRCPLAAPEVSRNIILFIKHHAFRLPSAFPLRG